MATQISKDKQALKTQRVKSYFIQATKEIIIHEGVECVSVRKVADKAGYTYTTIYNYYANVNELLKAVKDEMIKDVMLHMQGEIQEELIGLEQIKRMNRMYVAYYMDHPHIFHFFYLYRLSPESTEPEVPDFEKQWETTYSSFVERGIIQKEDIPVIAKTMIYTIHGLLSLFFSDNGMKKEALFNDLDAIANHLLGGK